MPTLRSIILMIGLIILTSFILTIIIAMSTIFYTSAFDESGQIKINEPTPLLKEDGSLTQPGYCFSELYQYDRSAIKANNPHQGMGLLSDIQQPLCYAGHNGGYFPRWSG